MEGKGEGERGDRGGENGEAGRGWIFFSRIRPCPRYSFGGHTSPIALPSSPTSLPRLRSGSNSSAVTPADRRAGAADARANTPSPRLNAETWCPAVETGLVGRDDIALFHAAAVGRGVSWSLCRDKDRVRWPMPRWWSPRG